MSLFQTAKPKSASKIMISQPDKLQDYVLSTLAEIATLAGRTLGPGGRQVLIERSEMNMKPIMTKDGVTVVKSLGYNSAIRQLILEAARDAAIRTAQEAGDGTTSSTILANAIAHSTAEIVKRHARISPQRIVRALESLVPVIIQVIERYKIQIDGENYNDVLFRVAELSANGDSALAKVILDAFNMVGEEGNMTIIEQSGVSAYNLDQISGYTIDRGYEESIRNYSSSFFNDRSGTMIILDNPLFILYDAVVNDISSLLDPLGKLGEAMAQARRQDKGVVLIAHGFSDSVLGDLKVNWDHPKSTVKVVPLLSPPSILDNGRKQFLLDLQAYTGAPVFDPISKPLTELNPITLMAGNRATYFECTRFRSSVVVNEDEALIDARVEELKHQLKKPESQYEENELNVRIGKLTSGIARLTISAPSSGESREKRDRAEDAWMAIRAAIKHGAVPGGGFTLVKASADMVALSLNCQDESTKIALDILADALVKPVEVLYGNYGYSPEDTHKMVLALFKAEEQTFDIAQQQWVNKNDLLDSLPAVTEAIRSSISVAGLLATVGGIIAFSRNAEADAEEQKYARRFEEAINTPLE